WRRCSRSRSGRGSRRRPRRARRRRPGRGLSLFQAYRERGAFLELGFHLDNAVVLLDNLLHHREPETGAAGLGGEVEVEDLLAVLGRDPGAVVGDGEADVLAVLGGADPDLAAGRQDLLRVDEQVEDRLADEVGIDLD